MSPLVEDRKVMDQRIFKLYESLGSLERDVLVRDLRMFGADLSADKPHTPNRIEALVSAFDLGAYINFTDVADDHTFRLMLTLDLDYEVHDISGGAAAAAHISFAIADSFARQAAAITVVGYEERVDDLDEVSGHVVWELRFDLWWPEGKNDDQVLSALDRLSAICS